jgi:hypothetical protein
MAHYLTRRWVPEGGRFHGWAVHSKAFHIRSCGCRSSPRQSAAIWPGQRGRGGRRRPNFEAAPVAAAKADALDSAVIVVLTAGGDKPSAAPPSNLMNLRRLIAPSGFRTRHRSGSSPKRKWPGYTGFVVDAIDLDCLPSSPARTALIHERHWFWTAHIPGL